MNLTIEQQQKIAVLRRVIIDHPHFEHAYQCVVDAYRMKVDVGLPQNIICVGPSGTGKSTLKEKMKNAYPVIEMKEKNITPVLVVDTPSVPTIKNVAEEMLVQLGDPSFNKGTAIEKTNRILHYINVCDVKMIIFDELQHFVDQGGKYITRQVSDWLKTVIDKAKVSVVLMGLERSEELLFINEQLRRRFSRRVNIRPFDLNQKESRESMIGVIRILDEKVGLSYRIDLKNKQTIKSFYFATNGIIDYLVKLFIGAYEQAVSMGLEELTVDCFEAAFSENIWAEGTGKLNPFSKAFIGEKLDKPGMPFHRMRVPSGALRASV